MLIRVAMTQNGHRIPNDYRRFLRLSLFAMFSTTIALVIGLAFVSIRLQSIAVDIAENAAPSIIALSDADRALESLRTSLGDRIDQIGDQTLLIDRINHSRTALRSSVTQYLDFPKFPGEAQLYVTIRENLTRVERIADRIEELPMNSIARAQVTAELRDASEDLSDEFDKAARFNAEYLHTERRSIDEIRQITLPLTITVNVIGFGVAAIALIIAFRTVRRFADSEAEARRQLEARANDLEIFSAQVAHDLLSPLSTMSLVLALVREKLQSNDQKTRDILTRAEMSLGHVRDLVDGLFAFARADLEPSVRASADVGRVLQEVAVSLGPIAERDKIEFIIEPFEHRIVAASPGIVGSMIENLVQNSFRAVAKCEIRSVIVRVSDERNGNADMVRISVQDTGGGVDRDIEPLLFQPHARNVRGRSSSGLGLGLAAVKRLAVRHGGTVGFRSEFGVGSTFWFALPVAHPSLPNPGVEN